MNTYTLPTSKPFGTGPDYSISDTKVTPNPFTIRYKFDRGEHPDAAPKPTAIFDTFFTLPRANLIGAMSADGHFTGWKVPTPNAGLGSLAFDQTGTDVWFTERDGNKIASLNPTTGKFKEYKLPKPKSGPDQISLDDRGNVFWTEGEANEVGLLHAGKISEFPLTPAKSRPSGIDVSPADDNMVFVVQKGNGAIAQLTFTGL